ncbi:MAG: GxxExxY protein [Candidatus Cloacimonadales bacterium]|nr:GxxExxY protein [Candidatus Cloacimonadales bacterium]
MKTKYLYEDITDKIIRCFYNVFDELGPGFLESVYEKALIYELNNMGFKVDSQKPIQVKYKEIICGNFIADLIVEDKIIIEIKAISCLLDVHGAQLINYLKATSIEVGMLVNFGAKFEFRRKIFTKDYFVPVSEKSARVCGKKRII